MQVFYAYVTAFVIVLIVEVFPSLSTANTMNSAWSRSVRPRLSPPNWVFPVVWNILYFLIAIALAQTLLLPSSAKVNILLFIYGFNLICNVLWSLTYFNQHDVGTALAILGVIVVSTGFLLYYTFLLLPFWVGLLLLPYQLWTIFAFYLNADSYSIVLSKNKKLI